MYIILLLCIDFILIHTFLFLNLLKLETVLMKNRKLLGTRWGLKFEIVRILP